MQAMQRSLKLKLILRVHDLQINLNNQAFRSIRTFMVTAGDTFVEGRAKVWLVERNLVKF